MKKSIINPVVTPVTSEIAVTNRQPIGFRRSQESLPDTIIHNEVDMHVAVPVINQLEELVLKIGASYFAKRQDNPNQLAAESQLIDMMNKAYVRYFEKIV